jgi:hypothetical protein
MVVASVLSPFVVSILEPVVERDAAIPVRSSLIRITTGVGGATLRIRIPIGIRRPIRIRISLAARNRPPSISIASIVASIPPAVVASITTSAVDHASIPVA